MNMDTTSHSLVSILTLPEADQRGFKDALAELLDRGSVLGFEPRSRDLYQRASGVWFEPLRSHWGK